MEEAEDKDWNEQWEQEGFTPIVIADERIANQRFLAFFTNGESLDTILKLLARNGNLRISRSGSMVYLHRK